MKTVRRCAAALLLTGIVCFLSGGCAATRELIRTDDLATKTVDTRLTAEAIQVFSPSGGSNVVVRLGLDSRRIPQSFQVATNDIVLREIPRAGRAIRPDPHATPLNMFVYMRNDVVMWTLGYINGHSYDLAQVQETDQASLLLHAEPSFSSNSLPCLFRYRTRKNAIVVGVEKTLLFPVAVAFDIVTSPWQILMKIMRGKV